MKSYNLPVAYWPQTTFDLYFNYFHHMDLMTLKSVDLKHQLFDLHEEHGSWYSVRTMLDMQPTIT